MDAFELLTKDHRNFTQLFDRVEQTADGDAATRTELFTQLKREIDAHSHAEETVLYPRLKQEEKTKDITMHGYEEHQGAKDLLKEIQGMSPEDEKWMEKLKELREDVEHHVKEEERDMFTKAREVLGQQEVDLIGDRLQEAKDRQLKQMSASAS